jgi:acyl-CoA reductase-like NAD-dependent aldehyde dehydrogenase
LTLHLPAWRGGAAYVSAESAPVPDVRGEVLAEVSQLNPGLVRRDVGRSSVAWRALRAVPTAERCAIVARAAEHFRHAVLPVGTSAQSWDAWVTSTSRSTGLPEAMVVRGGERVASAMSHVADTLRGLSRGVDPAVLDAGRGSVAGVDVGFVQAVRSLAAILPSNAPAVHGLWAVAPAFGLPLFVRPGSGDPFTPLRVLAALREAGLDASSLSYLPGAHDVGDALIDGAERAMVFGGAAVAKRYAAHPRVEVHGPGLSKIVVGPDVEIDDALLDTLFVSVAYNGGRSCINASTIAVCGDAAPIADALAERLGRLRLTDLDDPDAALAAFSDPSVARAIDAQVEASLGGAVDVTARFGPRLIAHDGMTGLRPTVVRCGLDHGLARTELPFPFVAVCEADPRTVIEALGPTLALTVVGEDASLVRAARDARHVQRLHEGLLPTCHLRWDQPHEGNLFDATWHRRAVG